MVVKVWTKSNDDTHRFTKYHLVKRMVRWIKWQSCINLETKTSSNFCSILSQLNHGTQMGVACQVKACFIMIAGSEVWLCVCLAANWILLKHWWRRGHCRLFCRPSAVPAEWGVKPVLSQTDRLIQLCFTFIRFCINSVHPTVKPSIWMCSILVFWGKFDLHKYLLPKILKVYWFSVNINQIKWLLFWHTSVDSVENTKNTGH